MIDRRRHVHPAPPGLPEAAALSSRPRAVVIGGGIAGLSAATGLAERGIAVDLVEREDYLGGRVGGWTEREGGAELAMNRGFHAFFRQYYNLRALLRRVDPELRMLAPVEDYPLIDGAGRRDSFRGLPRTPPWNALAFALRSPTFRLGDLARIDARAAAPLAAVSVPDIYRRLDHMDAETFLKSLNFPDSARHLAFEVFSRSFFAEPAQLSAAELATMFHIYFLGSSEGLIFDVATANFDVSLWNPLRQYLIDHGVRVHLGTSARRIATDPTSKTFHVETESGEVLDGDGVVLALDVGGLQQVVAASPVLETIRGATGYDSCAPRRRLWFIGCGWTGPWTRVGPPSSVRPGTSPSTTSVCSNVTNVKLPVGRGEITVRSSNCILTQPVPRQAGKRRSNSCISSTRRPALRAWLTSACCVEVTARCSPLACTHGDRRWQLRSTGWCWPVTESASTCRSR